jgi:hypothetical protein
MERGEYVDEKGRKYAALMNGSEQRILLGPPEGMMETLGLPEPFATTLHNILYARGLLNYAAAARQNLIGALQEAMQLDAQRLLEAYFKYEQTGG